MSVNVAIAGASGYAGGEVLRLLLDHPGVTVGALTAFTSAGEQVLSAHPHLAAHPALAGRTFTTTTAAELAGHDVVVLALPHGASGAIAAELEKLSGSAQPLLLDCGADHRLVDPAAWREYYGSEHAGTWTYGLPELIVADQPDSAITRGRERLAGATRIAVPGCNVTAVTLGIQPGVAAGLVDPSDLVAVLAVGYSGAGRAAKAHLLASEAAGSAVPYAVGGSHRHVPEIAQNLTVAGAGADVRISFTPVLVPMSRGILATTTAPLAPGADPAVVRGAWEAFYADEPFVHLLPEGQWPSSGATTGANTALVQVAYDAKARRIVTVCAIDNLVKGTAGAAIQSMNIALGLPETLGLPTTAVAP